MFGYMNCFHDHIKPIVLKLALNRYLTYHLLTSKQMSIDIY